MIGTQRQQPAPSPMVTLASPPDEKDPPPDAPATVPASPRRLAWADTGPQGLEIVEPPPSLADVRIVVREGQAAGGPGLVQAAPPQPPAPQEPAAPPTCGSKVKAGCVDAARVIGAVVVCPFAFVWAAASSASCVLAGAIDLVTCCRFRLVDRHWCND